MTQGPPSRPTGDARRPPGRRRRRGKGRPEGERPQQQPKAATRETTQLQRALEGSAIDASRPADVPLTEEEVAEARQHLRFLFKNREALRLKVNAAEDLLLNGAKAPTHRGQVVHLLGKVDLATVTSALSRLPDAKQRNAMLAGVVRFSSDVGLLLLYLESLHDVASRAAAASAFRLAVKRIDFSGLSPSRMRRILDLVASTFEGHQRVQVLFGLLESATFRGAFDSAQEAFSPELAALFTPLRAAFETILEGRPNERGPVVLRAGVRALLDAPTDVIQGYPEGMRERLLESSIRLLEDPALEDRATDALLGTLPKEGRSFSRIGMLRAAELLRRHRDDDAAALLRQIKLAHPGFHMPAKWLSALEAPRVARLALWKPETGAPSRDGRDRETRDAPTQFRSAFWIDAQRSCWVRVGRSEDAESMTRDALLQRQFAVAGVAPVIECGVTDDGVPYVVLPLVGRPLLPWLAKRQLSREHAFALALTAAQGLHALALAGVELPDAEPARYLAGDGDAPIAWLADLSGARRVDAGSASRAHRALAGALCASLEASSRDRDASLSLDPRDAAPSLADLIRSLAARG